MPGFVIHAFVPTLVMLGMRRYFDPRILILLWPLTLLPDLDYFVGTHRGTTTGLPFVGLVVLGVWGLARRLDPERVRVWTGTAAAYLGSHLVMDTFTGGIMPLYPFVDWTFCWFFYIQAETATNALTTYFEPCSHTGAPVVSEFYPVLGTDQAAMLVFIVLAWTAYAWAQIVELWRGRGPHPNEGPR